MASLAPSTARKRVDVVNAIPIDGMNPATSPSNANNQDKLKRVGDWIFGETLGQGSFGKVKLAHHAKTKEKVKKQDE
jgi:serine/threonine protein kinase